MSNLTAQFNNLLENRVVVGGSCLLTRVKIKDHIFPLVKSCTYILFHIVGWMFYMCRNSLTSMQSL